MALAAVFALLALLFSGSGTPADESDEAGFTRDMMVHHEQAVEMAGIAQSRTEDEEIRSLATDIMLTQQGQIGNMQGWMEVWNLPITGSEPRMGWMGHSMEPGERMPGMASQEAVNELATLPPEEADIRFLELMIPHHEAAIPMSEAIMHTDRPEVSRLAEAIAASQELEIDAMQQMLAERGEDPVESDPDMHEVHEDMDHSGH